MEIIMFLTGIQDLDICILSNLSYKNLLKIFRVNKTAYSISKNPTLWRKKMELDFPLRSKVHSNDYLSLYYKNPRKLYEIILKSKSKIIEIPASCFSEKQKEEIENCCLDPLIEIVKQQISSLPLLRGDVIRTGFSDDYRNLGKYMWDGENIDYTGGVIDDYGNVSESFRFPEFPLGHFSESISHNKINFISFEAYEELLMGQEGKYSSLYDPILEKESLVYMKEIREERPKNKEEFEEMSIPFWLEGEEEDGYYVH